MAKQKKKSRYSNIITLFIIFIILISGVVEYNDISNNEGANTSLQDEKQAISTNLENENLKVYFLDVGQGDSILVNCESNIMLIDAGNNKDGSLIVDFIKKLGINKIDYLVGTHPHEDHIGGLDDIIKNFEIEKILMPKKSTTTVSFEDVLDSIDEKNLKVNSPAIGNVFYLGDAKCEVISIDDSAENANNSSIVIELTYGETKVLFTGDIESDYEEKIKWEDIDVLKVAHHGSNTSTSDKFIKEVNPENAIISVGKNNDYNHPHKKILNRLKYMQTNVYRTDLDGTIVLTSDGKSYEIQKENISLDGNY